MADREDTSSLSSEENIARILEELETRIDSQADRLTEQLAPVEKTVPAIEEQLRILGYENGAPSQQNEQYRPHATPQPEPVDSRSPKSEVLDSEAPEFGEPDPEDSDLEESETDAPEWAVSEFNEPVSAELEFDEPNNEEPQFETTQFETPQFEEPEPDYSSAPDLKPEDGQTSNNNAGDGDLDIGSQSSNDLPFETDRPSDEDMNLADEALKSDLVGLFDDGEHADRTPTPFDPAVHPTPFPTAATPTRSRPIYLLVIALLFVATSIGIAAFIWSELTSSKVPFAADDRPPSETSTPASGPAAAPEPLSPARVQTTAPKPDTTTTPETTKPAPDEIAEPPEPEIATNETSAATTSGETTPDETTPDETPSGETPSGETTPGETTPGSQVSSTPAAAAQVAEKPAPTNSEIDKLLNLADAGDSEAQYEIAVRYLVGRGIEQSYVEAANWLQEAAAGGVISAQYNLGVLYDSGRGVEPDAVEALIWFHSAAEKGHGRAQYALAAAYAAGRGIERDSDMALKWLRRAAAENVLEAQSSLANILSTSPVSHNSLTEAYYWYRLADANGDGKAADRAELVAERLTPEERGDVNRRVSAFIAANITGKRQRTLPPAPPAPPLAPPAPPTPVPAAPVTDAAKAAIPKADTQTAAPPAGRPTNTERVRRIQAQLKSLGFEPGPTDGSLGGQTRDAIRNYQRALGLDVNGEPSEALLEHLRQISGFRK